MSAPPEPDSTSSAPAAGSRRDWRENLRFVADISQKMAVPLLTVAATGIGIYLSHEAQERASAAQQLEREIAAKQNQLLLKNQREQSETALRATMFRELASPLLEQGKIGTEPPEQAAQRLALLAELLTLNFHEHFELGPALRYVDRLPGQTQEARLRLRSTARRVISRQLAPMITESDVSDEGGHPSYFMIYLWGTTVDKAAGGTASQQADAMPPSSSCNPDGVPDVGSGLVVMNCGGMNVEGVQQNYLPPLVVTSPDGRDRITISISSFDWDDQSVVVSAVPESWTLPQGIEFTVSPYSLPFSDNTLLPTRNRFGLYIKSVEKLAIPDATGVTVEKPLMVVWFVWFPKGFVPPRERPFDIDVEVAPHVAPDGVSAEAEGSK